MAAKSDKRQAAGLRERKRLETRARLTKAAMALFLERGFDATTLDDIALAADVSRRNFFHYFASKEEVIFAWQEGFEAALIVAVEARPPEESLMDAAQHALAAVIGRIDWREALTIAKLKEDTPALHARDQMKYEALERKFAEALGRRLPAGPRNALRARLVAMAAIGVIRIFSDAWLAEGGNAQPEAYAKKAFEEFRAAISGADLE
jgi:AcrR family transcriptional regulator